MYELICVAANSYYMESPAKIGLIRIGENEVCLIDSGNDKDAGKKVRKVLDENGWKLTAIFNTHSHADHIGGNQYLQGQTNCKIYAPGIECDFTNHPILESSYLYGANPPKDLRHKFLMAKESQAELLTEAVLPEGITLLPLPGHSFDMVGFRSADDVVYLADCLSSKETLEKYQINFLVDPEAYVNTLKQVMEMQAQMFVPAHADATKEIAPLAQANIDKVFEISDRILEICKEPTVFEEILQQLFTGYELAMNFEQYVLVGSTVRSYLSWLRDSGKLQPVFENNHLLWERL